MHNTPLITTLVFGLGAAFVLGALAQRIRVSPLVGYLLAGVVVGPATPGIAADPAIAAELAEIGVILLMFGVGLHFSLKDLLSVRMIAVPGAVGQMAVATAMGAGLGWTMGWTLEASLLFGLALSVASTVVMMRALQERRLIETDEGRIAVGWLVVEDLAMVFALVLIPALAGVEASAVAVGSDHAPAPVASAAAGGADLALILALTVGKVAAFVAIMLIVGRRAIPWIMHYVAHTGSRELFRLAVLTLALGIAFGAAALFDVSLALGAFFAGMVMSESPLSQRAAEESLPFRDAFAVLFFVAVGMIFEPAIIVDEPLAVVATAAIIIAGKSVAAYLIVIAFGRSSRVALTISTSLAQVGEFSFILAGLGVALAILPEEGRDLVLAGAILSILFNPVMFALFDRWRSTHPPGEPGASPVAEPLPHFDLAHHAIVVGYGRVGSYAGEELIAAQVPIVVVEDNPRIIAELKARDVPVVPGNGVLDDVMAAADLEDASWLLVAIPEPFEASRIVSHARASNPRLTIIARAHFDAEVAHLREQGADFVIMGEREIARGMVDHVLDNDRAEPRGEMLSPRASSPAPSGAPGV